MNNPRLIGGKPLLKMVKGATPYKYGSINPGNSGRGRTAVIEVRTKTNAIYRRVSEGGKTIGWAYSRHIDPPQEHPAQTAADNEDAANIFQ
jgi:hypothetical protein